MRDCVKRLVEKSNGALNQKEAKELLESVDRLAKNRAMKGFDYDESVKSVLQERAQNVNDNITKQKESILRNLEVKTALTTRINDRIAQGLTIKQAMLAEVEGIQSKVSGTRLSVEAQQTAIESQYFSKLLRDLYKDDLLPLFNSKTMDTDISRELWALSRGEDFTTGNKQARQIAETLHNTTRQIVARLNKAGADIGEVDGFIFSQAHDPYKLHKMGKEAWIQKIKPLIDAERSFGDSNIDEALSAAYETLVTGVRLSDPLDDVKLFQFSGPANLAKKLSGRRQIYFKTADDFMNYNKEVGYKDLNENIIGAISYGAKNIALLERFGTNPQAMLETVFDKTKKTHRAILKEKGGRNYEKAVNDAIRGIIGADQIAGNQTIAAWGSNIRAYQAVTKLGGAVLSATADIGLKALEYQWQGKNFLSSYARAFGDTLQFLDGKQKRMEFSTAFGAGIEGMVGDVGARFSGMENLSGTASKVTRAYFKLNLLTQWTDGHKRSMGRAMGAMLGTQSKKSFDQLEPNMREMFSLYDITAKEWDVIRGSASELSDGRLYVTTDNIADQKIAEKLQAFYLDRINHGVITGGAKERRLATLATQRGTIVGELTRMMMQFKQFPITAITKVWGRALHSKGKADVPAIAQLMLVMGGFGYMAGAAKDIVRGKEPKDPTKKETILAAMAQGGGWGIAGDFFFSDFNSYGRSFAETLTGPTVGTVGDVAKLISGAMRGDTEAADLAKLGLQNLPLQNLFWIKPAFDHLLLYQIQESLNEGYIKRMERRMKKDYGQEFFIKP